MKHIYKILFLSTLLLISPIAAADTERDEPSLRAFASRKSINIGEKIKYTIEMRSIGSIEVQFPRFEDGKIGDIEFEEYRGLTKRSIFGRRIFLHTYSITSYSVGVHQIPALEVRYRKDAASEWAVKKIDPIDITVESVLKKDKVANDIKDIKGPLYFYEFNWMVVIGISALIISCFLIFAIFKKKKLIKPLKLPHEAALEELEAIRAFFLKTNDVKGYYIKISDCVRYYIERRFHLRAPEMTTEEFLNSLRDSPEIPYEHKNLLKEFLSSCDLVKFAKYAPNRQETDSVFRAAKKFIIKTSRDTRLTALIDSKPDYV